MRITMSLLVCLALTTLIQAADEPLHLRQPVGDGQAQRAGLAVAAGRAVALDIALGIAIEETTVTVRDEAVVSTDPDFTDQWYQGLNQGKYATWLTAAWGPVFLEGSANVFSIDLANPSAGWRTEADLPAARGHTDAVAKFTHSASTPSSSSSRSTATTPRATTTST